MRIALFITCLTDTLFSDTGQAVVRLLERLGFQREGTRREYSLEDDLTFHDSAVYGLLSSDH